MQKSGNANIAKASHIFTQIMKYIFTQKGHYILKSCKWHLSIY